MSASIIAHGGCGRVAQPQIPERQSGLESAVTGGLELLRHRHPALDAVELAVGVLEDDPHFNAGTGACLTLMGDAELDASVMTDDLRCGAVAGAKRVRHPVSAARAVMEKTDHVLLSGEGLEAFIKTLGLERNDPVTPERRKQWEDIVAALRRDEIRTDEFPELRFWKKIAATAHALLPAEDRKMHSTVGSVAIDEQGRLAAATSTGGIWFKLPGRIGDSAVIGAGTYASRHGAVSSTGHGEGIIRLCLAKFAVDLMERVSSQEALDCAIKIATQNDVECGLIGVDHRGALASAHNGETMLTAKAIL